MTEKTVELTCERVRTWVGGASTKALESAKRELGRDLAGTLLTGTRNDATAVRYELAMVVAELGRRAV